MCVCVCVCVCVCSEILCFPSGSDDKKSACNAKDLDLIPGLRRSPGEGNGCMHAQSLQSCLTLCDPMDCSPPGFSVHGILQTRILERVAMPSFRGSSQSGNQTHRCLCLLHCRLTLSHWATWEAQGMSTHSNILAWRIPWAEEPGKLQPMELQRAGHEWVTNTFTFMVKCYIAMRKNRQLLHVAIHMTPLNII